MKVELLLAERQRVADDVLAAKKSVRGLQMLLSAGEVDAYKRARMKAALATCTADLERLRDQLLQLEASVSPKAQQGSRLVRRNVGAASPGRTPGRR